MKGTYAWFRSNAYWRLVGSADIGASNHRPREFGYIKWSPRQNSYVWNQSYFIKDLHLEAIREIEDKLAELNEKEKSDLDVSNILGSVMGAALGSTVANIVNKRKKEDKEEDEE